MTLYKWSQTAATNATADGTIGWSEGQAPSSVNDSARGMMAATAKYRDDMAGVTTGGTSTAYTLTSNQVFNSLANMSGKAVTFVPHATNGATVTLNVDGLGAKALRPKPSVEMVAGVLVQGVPYTAVYNNATSEWIVIGVFGGLGTATPISFAAGTVMLFAQTAAPTGWTKDTSIDNAALRLVSGTASSGGTANFTSAFTSRTPAGTNSTSSISGTVTVLNDNWGVGGTASNGRLVTSNGNNSTDGDFVFSGGNTTNNFINAGTAAAQTFTGSAMDFAVKYVDVIRAAKD